MRWIGLVAVGAIAGVAVGVGKPDGWSSSATKRARAAPQTEEFRWRGSVADGEQLWIRNMNGEIRVEAAEGTEIEVLAEKRGKKNSPSAVEIVTVMGAGGVTICALWEARESSCEPGGGYRHSGKKKSDVNVRFVVRLPDGVPLDARNTNGKIVANGISSPVVAKTTNGSVVVATRTGDIEARTTNGTVEAQTGLGAIVARTTNGDIRVRIDALAEPTPLEFVTTNGSVTAELPASLNAELNVSLSNGKIDTDFPLTVQGRFNSRSIRATVGAGGPEVTIKTTNGSIRLHSVGTGEI
jgi:hypothetical protein